MTSPPTTARRHPKFGNDRDIKGGDPVTQNDRAGVVEVIDTRYQCSVGIRWADGSFTMEHPKGIVYTPEPPKQSFCVTATSAYLNKLSATLNRYSDGEAPDEDAFPTLLKAGFILEAAAQKALDR
jgi:hypothetical protein